LIKICDLKCVFFNY